jgi:hypothetical protein
MDKVVTTAAEAVADIAHPTRHVGGATASRGRRDTGVLHRDRDRDTGGLPWRYAEDGSVAVASPPKPTTAFEGRTFLLERALSADFAIVRAWKGDRHGNLLFRKAARNFNPVCAMAGRVAIAEVEVGPELCGRRNRVDSAIGERHSRHRPVPLRWR